MIKAFEVAKIAVKISDGASSENEQDSRRCLDYWLSEEERS